MGSSVSCLSGERTLPPIEYLKTSPFAVILEDEALDAFAECFKVLVLKPNAQVSRSNNETELLVVAEGQLDVSIVIPSKNKKANYMTSVLCTKKKGDLLCMAAVETMALDIHREDSAKPNLGRSAFSLLQDKTAAKMAGSAREAPRRMPSVREWRARDSASSSHGSKGNMQKLMRQLDLSTVTATYGAVLLQLDRAKFEQFEKSRIAAGPQPESPTSEPSSPTVASASRARATTEDTAPSEPSSPTTRARLDNKLDFACLRAMMVSNIQDYLHRIPFLAALPRNRLHMLSELSRFEVFDDGENLFREGECGDKIFVVVFGQLRVEATVQNPMTGESAVTTVNELAIGDYCGELAVMANIPSACTVTVVGRCLLVSIVRSAFRNMMNLVPDFAETVNRMLMLGMISNFLTQILATAEDTCEGDKIKTRLLETASIVECDHGTVLATAGMASEHFHFLAHGRCLRLADGVDPSSLLARDASNGTGVAGGTPGTAETGGQDTRRASLGVGDVLEEGAFWGDLAAIMDLPQPATVISTERCLLLRVPTKEFLDVWCSFPVMRSFFVVRLLGENVRLEHVLENYMSRKLFEKFVHSELAYESMEFYNRVWEFKTAQESLDEEVIMGEARRMYNMYLSETAEEQVNINERMRRSVLAEVERVGKQIEERGYRGARVRSILQHIFDPARAEAFMLLEKGPFYRFKHHSSYIDLLRRLKAYPPLLTKDQISFDRIKCAPTGCYKRPILKSDKPKLNRPLDAGSKILKNKLFSGKESDTRPPRIC